MSPGTGHPCSCPWHWGCCWLSHTSILMGQEKSLDGTGQVCHSVPIVGILMDVLLLVTPVHSLRY